MINLQSIYFMNSINNKIRLFIRTFAVFIPPSLITGPFLPDLFLSLIALIYLIFCFHDFKTKIEDKFVIMFIVFYFVLILTTVFSYKPFISLENSLFYFRYLFFSLAILLLLKSDDKFIKYLIFAITITFLIVYLDSFIQFTFGKNLTGYSYDPRGGINSFFGTNEDGILGSFVVRLMPIYCSLLVFNFSDDKGFTKFIVIILLLSASLIALFAQERSAFVLSLIPIFLYIFCTNVFSFKLKFYLIVLFIFAFILTFYLNHEIYLRFFTAVKNQVFLNDKIYIFSELHTAHYKSALKMFMESPFIGIGPKMFRYYCDFNLFYVENSCSTHPHNIYMQLLAETGVLGFIFIFSLFLYTLGSVVRQFLRLNLTNKPILKSYQILMISSLLITLWPIAPTGSFFNNWINIIYFIPVPFIIFFGQKK